MRIVSKKAKGECKVFLNNTPFKIMMNELLARVHTWLSAGKESTCNAGYPGSIPGSGRSPGEGLPLQYSWAFLVTQMVKNPPAVWEPWVHPWDGKIPWRRAWQPTPVFLTGESPGTEEPGRLHSPWSGKKLDMTEWLSTAWFPSEISYSGVLLTSVFIKPLPHPIGQRN